MSDTEKAIVETISQDAQVKICQLQAIMTACTAAGRLGLKVIPAVTTGSDPTLFKLEDVGHSVTINLDNVVLAADLLQFICAVTFDEELRYAGPPEYSAEEEFAYALQDMQSAVSLTWLAASVFGIDVSIPYNDPSVRSDMRLASANQPNVSFYLPLGKLQLAERIFRATQAAVSYHREKQAVKNQEREGRNADDVVF